MQCTCYSFTIHVERLAIQKRSFLNMATTGKQCRLNTIYITYNLFHQNKIERDVELQNTHIVPFESSCNVMQLSTLSAQIGKGIRASRLVSRRNICSLRSFLNCLAATNRRSITLIYKHRIHSPKFNISYCLKQSKFLDDEHTKVLYSPSVPIGFSTNANVFSFSLA